MITLQEALDMSWNIPAFWTYQVLRQKGVDVYGYMSQMGYEIPDYNIESLPLGGGLEVSVAQQTSAYQMLANNGHYMPRHIVSQIADSQGNVIYQHEAQGKQIFSPATATIMQQLLRGPLTSGLTTSFRSRLSALNGQLAGADWIGKTGTTNNYSDAWLMLATPTVSLGSWAGHDDNASLRELTGFNNNANYMAHLVNAIHQADPSIFGIGERFNLDSSVISSTVLKSTGLKPGSFTYNGKTYSINGETTTSYWAVNGPGFTTYKFAMGGTEGDYQKAWNRILGHQSSSDEKKPDDKKEKDSSDAKEEKDEAPKPEETPDEEAPAEAPE